MSELKWAIAREIPHLRRYARALTSDAVFADDLVQDTLERGLRKRNLWRRTGTLRNWLFRILYTTYLNDRRRARHRENTLDIDAFEGQLAVPASQEETLHAQDLVASLAELPDEQRAAILLVALEDLSYDEVAEVMGVPIGTIRSRLWRGRDALRVAAAASENENLRGVAHLRRVK